MDVPSYKVHEPKVNTARDLATRHLITSHEFITHAKLELASRLEKIRVSEERTLSRAIRKMEKEKLATEKKKSVAQKKLLGSKKRLLSNVKSQVVTNSELPQVLSKRARTFVTPFVTEGLSNSVGN